MASDYGIRHLIANFEELITILKDETGLACRSQVGAISKFTYGICSWSSGCVLHLAYHSKFSTNLELNQSLSVIEKLLQVGRVL